MTIFNDVISDHLTSSPVDEMARATHPGMAHFAGTGPSGKTCRECAFWNHFQFDYRAKNGRYGGLIKPARCNRFQQLTRQQGPEIPDQARACKYFEENPTPPQRYSK